MKMYIVLAKRIFSAEDRKALSGHPILDERISIAFPEPYVFWKIAEMDAQGIVIVEQYSLDLPTAERVVKALMNSEYPKYSDIKIYNLVEVN